MAKILLIDSLAILYRGHFAMMRHPLRSIDGTNTSGLFHLLALMLDETQSRSPDYTVAVFDFPAPSFRKELYPEYKANRAPMPEELRKQTNIARNLIPLLGFPMLEEEGFEADDIIAIIADTRSRKGDQIEILSPDKDLLQLVSDGVTVIRPGRSGGPSTIVDRQKVHDILGVDPSLVADFLALTGDSSDNIPGARGIGPKTALKLINGYGNLDHIYEEVDNVKPDTLRKKLIEGRKSVELSRILVSLPPPVLLRMDIMQIPQVTSASSEGLNMLDELGLRRITGKLNPDFQVASKTDEIPQADGEWCETSVINTIEELKRWLPEFSEEGSIAFDTETTSVRPFQADPVGISFSTDGTHSVYIPLADRDSCDLAEIASILSQKLSGHGLIAQNAKYDLHIADALGLEISSVQGDPMVASYLVEPESQSRSLSHMANSILNIHMQDYTDVLGGAETLALIPVEKVAHYCGCDSAAAYLLHGVFSEKLKSDSGLNKLYRELELPLIRVLANMEKRGVRLDLSSLAELDGELFSRIGELEKEASQAAGTSVNLSSPSQVSSILFHRLELSPSRKTRKGALSSGMDVLQKLRGKHAFVDIVIEHRELSKLLNTYVRKLPGYICSRDGLVHTNFSQTVAATGRLSSSSPNLQNIPIRTSKGREVRKCFRPGIPGNIFISADYSQIELRVLAHFAGPGNLRESFENNMDIHASTAVALFGDASPEHRRKAKEVNFSIMYGISPWGLSNRMGISREEAAGIIDRYFATYPELDFFFRKCVADAEASGETRTILQRRRDLRGLISSKGAERRSLERIAVNTTIQGSAADIIKVAMLSVERNLKDMENTGLVLQVHDELVVSCPENCLENVRKILIDEMETAIDLDVPLTVETGHGQDWLEAQH